MEREHYVQEVQQSTEETQVNYSATLEAVTVLLDKAAFARASPWKSHDIAQAAFKRAEEDLCKATSTIDEIAGGLSN